MNDYVNLAAMTATAHVPGSETIDVSWWKATFQVPFTWT
jgi:hypothetical protein